MPPRKKAEAIPASDHRTPPPALPGGAFVVYDTVLKRVIAGPTDEATADAIAKSAAHKSTVRKAS